MNWKLTKETRAKITENEKDYTVANNYLMT